MHKIVQRLLNILGLSAFATIVVATVVALRHLLETPQPLESILPGDAHIYRWRQGHLFYKTLGNKDAPPLVLLHAPTIAASAYEMRNIMEPLAQHYFVYALDLLGFGLSDRPHIDYSADTYISLCHDFLTGVVKQSATLLASGLSCNYALILAQRFPALCAGLILLSPTELSGSTQEQNVWAELLQLPAVGRFLYPLLCTRPALRYTLARQRSPHEGHVSEADVDYMYATAHQFGGQYAPMARLAGKLAVNAVQQFDTLQQPTLVIWGARALHNTRALTSQEHLPAQAEMVLIQDADRYAHKEYPSMVVANIREWREAGTIGTKAKTQEPSINTTAKAPVSPTPLQTHAVRSTTEAERPVTGAEPAATTAEVPTPTQTQESKTEEEKHEPEIEEDEQQAEPDTDEELIAYCVRCKKKTVMLEPQEVTMKNGTPAIKGKCSVCGAGQYRIGRLEKQHSS